MPKTYYAWTGVGEIEDFDGDGAHPAVTTREDAIALFSLLATQREGDLTVWERDGPTAKLIAAKFGYEVVIIGVTRHGPFHVVRKGG